VVTQIKRFENANRVLTPLEVVQSQVATDGAEGLLRLPHRWARRLVERHRVRAPNTDRGMAFGVIGLKERFGERATRIELAFSWECQVN